MAVELKDFEMVSDYSLLQRNEENPDEASFSTPPPTPVASLNGSTSAVSLTDVSTSLNEETSRSRRDSGATAEELILTVVDTMEDEWDEHAYEDIVPWEIKLAIEAQVFGWDHLISSILGHVAFTLSAFGLVYLVCYQLVPQYFWLRWILASIAALSSYRMVRRRRRVWFRAPYGSQRYLQDSQRRYKDVVEADNTSWLGRIRRLRGQRKVLKQLKRAETNFLEHLDNHEKRRLNRTMTDPSVESTKPRRRPSFQTDPVPVMQSIQHDQILFANGPIKRVLYTHGSYFGAAPFLLNNPHWISILRHLMPDVYVEISRRVLRAPTCKLIHWAENNPVVAAYGTAQSLEFSGIIPSVEWDVFLDPYIVDSVSIVLREREKFLLFVCGEQNGDNTLLAQVRRRPMESISIPACNTLFSQSQRGILRYYNAQLKKRVRLLVDKMLIAHGNLTQLALEQTGFVKHYIYSRVRRTRRTLGGGIYARQWMSVYAESLRIGVLDDGVLPPPSPPELGGGGSTLNAIAETLCPDTSIARSVEIVQSICKCSEPVGLVLDLKSRHVPKAVWACVVDMLRADGVRVEGMGAFVMDDIRGLSQHTIKPVKEIMLLHSAGELQRACHDGRIQRGDSVVFNGGSLIWSPASSIRSFLWYDAFQIKRSYRLYPFAHTTPQRRSFDESASSSTPMVTSSSTIEQYKQYFDLSIGLYVQEFAIDDAALNLLVDYVNQNQHIYDLGLNWGGVNGITIRGIQPDRFTCTDGYWNQRHIGSHWDTSLSPPPISYQANARLN